MSLKIKVQEVKRKSKDKSLLNTAGKVLSRALGGLKSTDLAYSHTVTPYSQEDGISCRNTILFQNEAIIMRDVSEWTWAMTVVQVWLMVSRISIACLCFLVDSGHYSRMERRVIGRRGELVGSSCM